MWQHGWKPAYATPAVIAIRPAGNDVRVPYFMTIYPMVVETFHQILKVIKVICWLL